MVAGEAGVAPTVDVRCDNSILSVLPGHSMIKMKGPIEMDEWLSRLLWKGTANYIDAVGSWWEISADRSISSPLRTFNASDWSQHWNSTGNASIDRNSFESPDLWDAPVFHAVSRKAFQLLPTSQFYRAPEALMAPTRVSTGGSPKSPPSCPCRNDEPGSADETYFSNRTDRLHAGSQLARHASGPRAGPHRRSVGPLRRPWNGSCFIRSRSREPI